MSASTRPPGSASRKLLVTTAIASAFLVLIGWISPRPASLNLPLGELFDVAIEGDAAWIELPPASKQESYLLVVSNLSRQVEPAPVELRAEAVEGSDADRRLLANVGSRWLARRPLQAVERLSPKVWERAAVLSPPQVHHTASAGQLSQAAVTQVGDLQPGVLTEPAPQRRFWLQVGTSGSENPASYQQIRTRLASCSEQVAVYVDESDRVPQETLSEIVRVFEAQVLPRLGRWLGRAEDIDGDGRFCIVLTSWLARLDDGRLSLGGMVSPADFDGQGEAPRSNRADVLYLNADTRPGQHLATLLAHEYAHAVVCSARLGKASQYTAAVSEESWLNEALAHVAENLQGDVWTNLEDRIAAKLANPQRGSIVVPRGLAALYGRDPAIRGGGYLFLRWCVARYGPGLIGPLVHSQTSGIENLETATGVPFESLYRQYAVELFLKDWSDVGAGGESIQTVSTACASTAAPEASTPLAMPRLRGKTGRHSLSGPAFRDWNLDETARLERTDVSGTSSCYTVLRASPGGPRRVHLSLGGHGRWQVTLVRLGEPPREQPLESKPRLVADTISTALNETGQASGGNRQAIAQPAR